MWTTDSSAGDGLKKLADYLAQTRRQAEVSIDVLNSRVTELTAELDIAKQTAERLQEERDLFHNMSEQLKIENSKKWRLQERDDWKSLVDSVQRDRCRLQDECHRLETELEEVKEQLAALQQQQQQRAAQSSPAPSSSSRFFFGSPILTTGQSSSSSSSSAAAAAAAGSESPTDGTGPGLAGGEASSPRAMTKQLKLELAKAHSKLQVERASAQAMMQSQESEISRLRQELERSKRSRSMHASGTVWARGASGGGLRLWGGGGGTGGSTGGGDGAGRMVGGYHGQGGGWTPFALFNYFFASAAEPSTNDGGLTGVLHV